jgi:hypothetical protein
MSDGWSPPPEVVEVTIRGRRVRAILEPGQAFAGGDPPPTDQRYVIAVGEHRLSGFLARYDDTVDTVRRRLDRWAADNPAYLEAP